MLGIKFMLEILNSHCWKQLEPMALVQAIAACAAFCPKSALAVQLSWLQIQKLENV